MFKSTSMQFSRRDLLKGTVTGIMAAGLPEWYTNSAIASELERDADNSTRLGVNDQINIAVIGPGGKKGGYRQGLGDTLNASRKQGVKVVAVCDLDKTHAEDAAQMFGPDCKIYHDFREVVARPEIDAVIIGTPDHWHALISIAAMKAGKDVYCENR